MLRQVMIRAFAIGILVSAMNVRADDDADRLAHAGVATFDAAYRGWNSDQFAKAAHQFKQATQKNPHSATFHYWLGAASFHRMLKIQNGPNPDMKAADAAMADAIQAFEKAVELDPKHGESHALLGTLYGMKIQGGFVNAMRYGPRVQSHQKHALNSNGLNPRIRYLLGAGRFHVAKNHEAYRVALATLLSAEVLFLAEAKQPLKPLDPRWGLSSCRTFIGLTYLKLDDKAHAAEFFKKALADHPSDHIAARELARIVSH